MTEKENHMELLENVWVSLDEIVGVLSAVEKGLDMETEADVSSSVIRLVKRQLEEVLGEIDKAL